MRQPDRLFGLAVWTGCLVSTNSCILNWRDDAAWFGQEWINLLARQKRPEQPTHTYSAFGDRGDIVGAYCTVKTSGGDYLTEEMSIAEIIKIRDRSDGFKSGKNSPWLTDFGEMARKTVVKRAEKYWPKTDRLDHAIHYLNTDAGEGLQQEPERDISPCNTDQLNQISAQLNRIGRTESQLLEKLIPSLTGRNLNSLDELTSDEAIKVISDLERR